MPYPSFPDIQKPDLGGFREIPPSFESNTISSPTEAGYRQTRSRFTRQPWRFALAWEGCPLTPADYALLKTFFGTVNFGAGIFTWVHPFTGTSYNVRFAEIGEFILVSDGGVPGWTGSVILEVV